MDIFNFLKTIIAQTQPYLGIVLSFLALWLAAGLIGAAIRRLVRRSLVHFSTKENQKLSRLAGRLVIFILWLAGLVLILDNLGVNLNNFVTGLGISGVVVALATQKFFGDLLNSVIIYFDKPFVAGDIIFFDGLIGKVKKVGWRTTRLTAAAGEEIIIANINLVAGKIINYHRLEKGIKLWEQAGQDQAK